MSCLSDGGIPTDKAKIKELLRDGGKENFADYITFLKACGENTDNIESLFNEIIERNEPYLISHLALGGNDLIEMGLCGEEIGKALEGFLSVVQKHPEKNNKKDLLLLL